MHMDVLDCDFLLTPLASVAVKRPWAPPPDGTRATAGSWAPSEACSWIGRRLRAVRAMAVASFPEMRDFGSFSGVCDSTIQRVLRPNRAGAWHSDATAVSSPVSQEPSHPAAASQSRTGSQLLLPCRVRA